MFCFKNPRFWKKINMHGIQRYYFLKTLFYVCKFITKSYCWNIKFQKQISKCLRFIMYKEFQIWVSFSNCTEVYLDVVTGRDVVVSFVLVDGVVGVVVRNGISEFQNIRISQYILNHKEHTNTQLVYLKYNNDI